MQQGWRTFLNYPLTGIGAGQFQNYEEPGEKTRWRVTHNTPLQVAAEVGILGVLALAFLVFRGLKASLWVRRTLRGSSWRRGAQTDPEDGLAPHERAFLSEQATAMVACMVGWLIASQFASVAYNWTIYYLLGLCVTARDVVRARERAYARAKAIGSEEVVAA